MQKNSQIKYTKIDHQMGFEGKSGKLININAKVNEVNLDQIDEDENINMDNRLIQDNNLENKSNKKAKSVKNNTEFDKIDNKIYSENLKSNKELKSNLSNRSFNSEAKDENIDNVDINQIVNSKIEDNIPMSNPIEKNKLPIKFENQPNDVRFFTLTKDNIQNHFEEINLTKFSTTKNLKKNII